MTASKQNASSDAVATDRTVEVYKQAVRKNFSFLKQTMQLDDLFAKSIPLAHGAGFLVPVCELHATDDGLIAKLAQWRAENAFAYPTQFPVTIAGTTSWLRSKLLDVEDRILFLVLDRYGNPIGHLGCGCPHCGPCRQVVPNRISQGWSDFWMPDTATRDRAVRSRHRKGCLALYRQLLQGWGLQCGSSGLRIHCHPA